MAGLTDAELLKELELLEQEEIHALKEELRHYGPYTNPNYRFLHESLIHQRYEIHKKTGKPVIVSGKRGCVLEGSSRSGKTWAGIDMIICIALFIEKAATINIYRATYNEFKTTLYDDFKRRLDDFGLDNPFHRSKEIQSFKIKGCTVHFLGDGKHGGGCDYAFYNEGMFISKEVFDQSEMRCRKFWWIDYNPSLTQHWIFNNVIPRPDVGFLRTTFLDNPFISIQEKSKILGYEPWLPGSYEITLEGELKCYNPLTGKVEKLTDKNQPPPHPTNIESGTADAFKWKVYGLGLRGAMQGVIFPEVEYIDEFPDIGYTYANDFGFTADPNATVKYAEDEENIWAELVCYEPVETSDELDAIFEALGLRKGAYSPGGELRGGDLITCDSSDKHVSENKGTIEMVKNLRKRKWQAKKVSKTKSVVFWLGSMKEKKIHIVRNRYYEQAKAEQQNYRWKEVQGIQINQPIDAFNHMWDAIRYGHIAHNSKPEVYRTDKTLAELGINY